MPIRLPKLSSLRSFHLYVATVILAGAGAIIITLPRAQLADVASAPFWLFAALLLLAELRPIEWLGRHGGAEVTASWTFSFALLLLTPEWAIIVTAVACLTAEAVHRKGPVRMLFNTAQIVVSLTIAALVLRALAPAPPVPGGVTAEWLFAVTLAGASAFLLNGLLTCTVLALHRRRTVVGTIRQGLLQNLSTDGMLLALAPVFAVLAQLAFGIVPFLLLTAWAVYRSTVLAVRREHEATHDQLTGLANRRYFTDQAQDALQAATKRNASVALALIDLNSFKEINDLLGHHIGDRVLQVVARRLNDCRRAGDLAARLGGDEFAVLLRDAGTPADASAAAERLHAELSRPCVVEGFPLSITGSFGVSLAPDHGSDVDTLLQNADVAMYRAKQDDGGVTLYSNESDRFGKSRMGLLTEVQRAIECHEFLLHWQPKVDIHTGEVVGAEALVRWDHPSLGLVPPDEFIPLAEHTDLMGPFTEAVLDLALGQARSWADDGLVIDVSVNGSARTLHDLQFPGAVRRLLTKWDLPAHALDIEITENTMLADPVRTRAVVHDLRSIGVSLSIDDFGTGYSSLANLRDLPVSRVKIDRSFVRDMVRVHGDQVIVRSIIDLAGNLGLGTVAEGVEDRETLDLLRSLGCDVAQGYLLSRPLPAADFVAWLDRPLVLSEGGDTAS
ncbi:MAG: bifunctional diguanylate cyclase/phosphodiesterase [Actinomycetota bacterium]|nr:bifunctional diguanylate cyclase/phosphodiesterase [Actinomycetota bacterium]